MRKSLKKVVALGATVTVTASLAIGGTMAYYTDTASDVNVMTLGNVKIAQHEYERAVDTNGAFETIETDRGVGYELVAFSQNKPLYPAVGQVTGWDSTRVFYDQFGEGHELGAMDVLAGINNVQDKFIFVENTGKSDAYVRTVIAFESGSLTAEEFDEVISTNAHSYWDYNDVGIVEIDENNYFVMEAVYSGANGANGRHPDGIVHPGDYTYNSLAQIYMASTATNEIAEAIDGNGNGNYDILVLSQAVQTAGFSSAKSALDAGFGVANADNVKQWFAGVYDEYLSEVNKTKVDPRVTYNGTVYDSLAEAVEAANANGGGELVMQGCLELDETLEIASNITIKGDGYTITRADGYTGTMFTVKAGATVTMDAVILDGEGTPGSTANAATGNLIATEGNGSIVLNAGTVLKNNVGAHAVSLATRGGGSLTLNGAEISNNQSDSGAIWGGGLITVNEGSKINYNSSTGAAGAIRMVGSCNFVMNGGEIKYNKAAGDGGVIWGYGASNYKLYGGEISNNESAGTGGFLYTGTYSTVDVQGTVIKDNTAANSGAIRLTDHTSLEMHSGVIAGNTETENSGNYDIHTWNNSITLSGGTFGKMEFAGGLGLTIGNADVELISYDLSTNHNTAYLAESFGTFHFTVNEADEHFANFNFKPAAGYVYTAGDEAKLICDNEGYETYWDTGSGTFKLQAK